MKPFVTGMKIESKLFFRGFFGPFYALVFPIMMLVLFGSIYGNESNPMFNGYGAIDVSIPAYTAMVIGACGLMSLPLSISDYKDKKIYKRLDATPVSKGLIMQIQFLINMIASLTGILLLIIAGIVLYQGKIDGDFLSILFAVVLSIISIFSIGFFITSIARDGKIANVFCHIIYFIMLFASGATIPRELFPDSIMLFSKVLPLTYAVDLLKTVFANKPIGDYWIDIVVLLSISVFLYTTSALIYKHKRWD